MSHQVLVLADDLTGALEAGAKFACRGLAALVAIDRSPIPAEPDEAILVLVVDTETRHVEAAQAQRVVYRLARTAREGGVRLIFKKTDSTLRGHIGNELAGLLEACPGLPLLYAPAYPQLGRTVREGLLRVDDVPVSQTSFAADALNPIVESHIPTLLASAGLTVPVLSVRPDQLPVGLAPAVFVVDGEQEEHLRSAARALASSSGLRLAAGPAAFAPHLAEFFNLPEFIPPAWPGIESCLVVNGSRHPNSQAQVAQARGRGWPSGDPEGIPEAISDHRWAILDNPAMGAGSGLDHAARLGVLVRDILLRTDLDAIVVFGGDTAHGILTALAFPPLFPIGEALPGVPVSRIAARSLPERFRSRERDLYLISKAGGFGSRDLLPQIRRRFSNQRLEA